MEAERKKQGWSDVFTTPKRAGQSIYKDSFKTRHEDSFAQFARKTRSSISNYQLDDESIYVEEADNAFSKFIKKMHNAIKGLFNR